MLKLVVESYKTIADAATGSYNQTGYADKRVQKAFKLHANN